MRVIAFIGLCTLILRANGDGGFQPSADKKPQDGISIVTPSDQFPDIQPSDDNENVKSEYGAKITTSERPSNKPLHSVEPIRRQNGASVPPLNGFFNDVQSFNNIFKPPSGPEIIPALGKLNPLPSPIFVVQPENTDKMRSTKKSSNEDQISTNNGPEDGTRNINLSPTSNSTPRTCNNGICRQRQSKPQNGTNTNAPLDVFPVLPSSLPDFLNPKNGVKVANKVPQIFKNITSNITDIKEKIVDCYKGLGCFPNSEPWRSILRPFPAPMKPEEIDTKVYLYTRKNPDERYTVRLWDDISLEGSDFDPNRPYTVFITHGFASSGNVSWVSELKDAYLEKRDANVFIVDWGKGASNWNYLQVASNTRIVGAELARFGKYLVEQGVDPKKIHLMGHSLGAHISSYMAKALPKIAQLSAFDPAQPGFEGTPDIVRLSKNDADFVDVLHTSAKPTIPLLGFGLILPTGHVDYYLNGGSAQPGCLLPPVDQVKLGGIADLGKYPVEVISTWVSCSHGKSYLYYTEALLNNYCTFWGKSVGILSAAFDVGTVGFSEKFLTPFSSQCTLEKCLPVGLESQDYPARGAFVVSTHPGSPYCYDDPKITKAMREQRARQTSQNNNEKNVSQERLPEKGLNKVKDILRTVPARLF